MTEILHPKPGDLLEYRCPNFGIVWQWRVRSVCYGAGRQEDLIEVSPVMAANGNAGGEVAKTCWVPMPMTRNLTIVRLKEPPHE